MNFQSKQPQNLDNTIYIEYCIDCNSHNWCTKHDEKRYLSNYEHIKNQLEQTFLDLYVLGNHSYLTNKKIDPPLGGFEIKFRNNVIFSKLNTGQWPQISSIIKRINTILEEGFNPDKMNLDDKYSEYIKNIDSYNSPNETEKRKKPNSNHYSGENKNIKDPLYEQQNLHSNDQIDRNFHFSHVQERNSKASPISIDSKKTDNNNVSDGHKKHINSDKKQSPNAFNLDTNSSTNTLIDNLKKDFGKSPLLNSKDNNTKDKEYFRIPISKRRIYFHSNNPTNDASNPDTSQFEMNLTSVKEDYINEHMTNEKMIILNPNQKINNSKETASLNYNEDINNNNNITNKKEYHMFRNNLAEEFLKEKNKFKADILGGNIPYAERILTAHPLNHRTPRKFSSPGNTINNVGFAESVSPSQYRSFRKGSPPFNTKFRDVGSAEHIKSKKITFAGMNHKKVIFPILKATTLQVSKKQPVVKKITLRPKEQGIYKLAIEVSDINIVNIKDNIEFETSYNKPFKLPLIFAYNNSDDKKNYVVQIYMNQKPWMRIFITVYYL